MKPIYGITIMIIIIILLAAASTLVITQEYTTSPTTAPANTTTLNNADDFSEISYHHLNFQCSDGVVCYHVSGEGMWCTRDCDLVKKHCPLYRGFCNSCNGMVSP